MSEIPERIWLQTGSAAEHGEAQGPEMDEDVTWCCDAIYKHDTAYIRASKVEAKERGELMKKNALKRELELIAHELEREGVRKVYDRLRAILDSQ